jgi:hypothetical protein
VIDEVKEGLVEVRNLVDSTHWIQGSYVTVDYLNGDGVYTDGAVVEDRKVVGCLVGLARLVAAKLPLYTINGTVDLEMPAPTALSVALEEAIKETILDEFLGDEYVPDYYEGDHHVEEDISSIEAWNDRDVRTREQVLRMIDRAIERVSLQEASA